MGRLTNLLSVAVPLLITACATVESKLHARADAGDPEAQYQLASLYWNGNEVDQDRNEALKWYQLAAQHGHPGAQVKVAEVYEIGQGVSQDYLRASQWYAKAVEKGDSNAQVRLAKLYIKGYGVPQNYAEAIKLLEQATAHQQAEAEYLLGTLYREGRGVPKDLVRAHMWFNIAAAQGNNRGRTLRDVTATEMNGPQLAEAQRLAVEQVKVRSR